MGVSTAQQADALTYAPEIFAEDQSCGEDQDDAHLSENILSQALIPAGHFRQPRFRHGGANQDKLADKFDEAETVSQADSTEATSAGSGASATLEPSWDVHSIDSGPECESKVQSQGRLTMYGDLCRAIGTTAKLAGAAGESHLVCGPMAVAGSAAGLATGCAQLHRGLSTPSGLVDQHLVSKGAATTGIGAANVCICTKATFMACPHLFAVALALSVVNTGVASAVDARMNGLCNACREATDQQGPGAVATAPEPGASGSLLTCLYR